jgi:hypothetical protein
MAHIRVTATVTFDYDTDEGVIETAEEAEQDVRDLINSGDLLAHQYEFSTFEYEDDENEERGDICMALRDAGAPMAADEAGGMTIEDAREMYRQVMGKEWSR